MVDVIFECTCAEAVDYPHAWQRGHVGFVEEAVDLVFGVGGGFADEVEFGVGVFAVYWTM